MTIFGPLSGTNLEVGGIRYCPARDVHFIGENAAAYKEYAESAQSAKPPTDGPEAPKRVTPQRRFCIVEAIPLGGDDFEILGVFSKREDADQYLAELEVTPDLILKGACGIREGITMDVIKRALAADRLGKLAASIDRLIEIAGPC